MRSSFAFPIAPKTPSCRLPASTRRPPPNLCWAANVCDFSLVPKLQLGNAPPRDSASQHAGSRCPPTVPRFVQQSALAAHPRISGSLSFAGPRAASSSTRRSPPPGRSSPRNRASAAVPRRMDRVPGRCAPHCGLEPVAHGPDCSAGTRTTRKPVWHSPTVGSPMKRYAERQFQSWQLQLPPRFTQYEAAPGPGGSSRGDFA